MIRDTALLLKVQILGFFGLNRLMHVGTRREKLRMLLLAAGMGLIVLLMAAYSAGLALGLSYMGLISAVPPLVLSVASVITLFTGIVKCNGVLFGYLDYDMVASLPVSRLSIVFSRLLSIYFMSFLFSLVAMLPALIVYGLNMAAPFSAWVMLALSLILAPLLPLALAVVAGAAVMAVSARFRRRNLLAIVLTFAVMLGVIGLSFSLQSAGEAQFIAFGSMIASGIERFYPPAGLFHRALAGADWAAFATFAIASLGAMALVTALLAKFYGQINSMLSAKHARGNYRLGEFKAVSPLAALYKRELKRLFSSTIYATNTLAGAFMMVAMGVAICALGAGKLEAILELTGVAALFGRFAPIACSFMVAMSSTTACSLSLDGKTRWIAYSAPVMARQIFDAKILVNFTVLFPLILITGALVAVGLKTSALDTLLIFLMPASYACFAAVAGLLVNLKFPKYDWSSEYEVVKRGASMAATMGLGFAALIAPIVLCVVFTGRAQVVVAATTAAIFALSGVLYCRLMRKRLFI